MTLGAQPSVSGRVDSQGRLLSADPRLLALQLQAGGEEQGVLAVPQLASIVQLAQNLGLLVSRNVMAAEGRNDLELIVQARPDGDETHLQISGWKTLKSASARFGTQPEMIKQEWLWETDDELKLIGSSGYQGVYDTIGQSFDQVFQLEPADDGIFPILLAFATRRGFTQQIARLREDDDDGVLLSGLPVFDRFGTFRGWRGSAVRDRLVPLSAATAHPPAPQHTAEHYYARHLNASLRPPLAHIIAQADDILAQREGIVARHYLDYATDIAAAGRHLLGLVDDLNDAQNIETPDFTIATDEIDLADVARRAASLLSVRAGDKNVRIDAPFADESLMARGDFRRILQILVNLIGNAVRYSPPGAVIWVRPEQEGDLAAIVVADQGKGIPAEAQDHIFEKFARLDKNELGGTGLGLYISRKLARAMGGDISVDSAPGQGARFVLTLPIG
jgi:signal transduction histidine kinase